MATYTSNTRIRHDSDAVFREWAQDFHDALAAIGAVQTGDTGQINLTTVTRAGVNADAGYEVWYMNDSLHGTSPVYFKLYYGTGATTTRPRLRIELGTGSNGSGTLTGGDAVVATISTTAAADYTADTAFATYACMARGCLWVIAKIGKPASSFANHGFFIGRNCDAAGAADSTAIVFIGHNRTTSNSSSVYSKRCKFSGTGSGWSAEISNGLGHWPPPDTTSVADEDGNFQFMIPFYAARRPRPWNNYLCCWDADVTASNTYSLTGVGSTAFVYMSVKAYLGVTFRDHANTGGNNGPLFVYE